jgi:hypothetical protein
MLYPHLSDKDQDNGAKLHGAGGDFRSFYGWRTVLAIHNYHG